MTRVTPAGQRLKWFMECVQPEAFANMIGFCRALNPDLTIYLTDQRRKVDLPDGTNAVVGFRGVAVDAIDPGRVCMTIARLAEAVVLSPEPGAGVDDLPSAPSEVPVRFDTKTLHAMVKEVRANEHLLFYQVKGAPTVTISTTEAGGECAISHVRTLSDPGNHDTLNDLCYKYQLTVPLGTVKLFLRRAEEIRADSVKITYCQAPDTGAVSEEGVSIVQRLLCLEARGDICETVRVLPVKIVSSVSGSGSGSVTGTGAGTGSDEPEMSAYASVSERIATLKAQDQSRSYNDQQVVSLTAEDIVKLEKLHSSTYGLPIISSVIKPLSGDTLLTVFLSGNISNPEDTSPLLLRFELGKPESYVAFAIAARLPEAETV